MALGHPSIPFYPFLPCYPPHVYIDLYCSGYFISPMFITAHLHLGLFHFVYFNPAIYSGILKIQYLQRLLPKMTLTQQRSLILKWPWSKINTKPKIILDEKEPPQNKPTNKWLWPKITFHQNRPRHKITSDTKNNLLQKWFTIKMYRTRIKPDTKIIIAQKMITAWK